MSNDTTTIASIKFNKDRETVLDLAELHTWVIWQFPRRLSGGLCAAVKSPRVDTGWIPAIIPLREKKVIVYAHAGHAFESPDSAVDWLFDHKVT